MCGGGGRDYKDQSNLHHQGVFTQRVKGPKASDTHVPTRTHTVIRTFHNDAHFKIVTSPFAALNNALCFKLGAAADNEILHSWSEIKGCMLWSLISQVRFGSMILLGVPRPLTRLCGSPT